jgi:predicted DNA-binding transcriptional regulator YafY
MPLNRNALIRYKTIDNCLRNRFRKWTLDDLVEQCSDALYEYEGIEKGVSLRTVQMDIQLMRSEKLGYNAPIVVKDKKFYSYEDPKYSITNIPLTGQDLQVLGEVVSLLQQFKGFSHFQEMGEMVNRLKDKIHTGKTQQNAVIDFEKNDHLVGLHWLDKLYEAIVKKQVLRVSYQSFKSRMPNEVIFHAHLLKEYRNRWFLLGLKQNPRSNEHKQESAPILLALDRIKEISVHLTQSFKTNNDLNASFFEDIVGVTRNVGMRVSNVRFWITEAHVPYVLTKPIHKSQKMEEKTETGSIFSIKVIPNFELEREILGFGEDIEVLAPRHLRVKILQRLQKNVANYAEKEA